MRFKKGMLAGVGLLAGLLLATGCENQPSETAKKATSDQATASVNSAGKSTIAKLCANCHEAEPGVMMGFLESIAYKSKTIQMNLLSHKSVVKFTDNTTFKNVASLKDIRNYQGKGFQINFSDKDGAKVATEIIRFDILKTIKPEEKLDKAAFIAKMHQPNTVVYDVRPPMKYKEAHIAGAKMLPAPAFNKFKKTLPQDKNTAILLYGVGGCLSPTTAMNLKALDYKNVSIYFGGFPDWSKTNYGITTPDWLAMAISKDIPHVLIDLRDSKSVEAGHIKGAVSMALAALNSKKGEFPAKKNAPIILYGAGKEDAAKTIVSWGYKKVRLLPIDFATWQAAGKPVAQGKAAQKIVYVPKAKPGTISMDEFKAIAEHPNAETVIIDVRNPDEAAKGKIQSAINIPADQIVTRQNEIPANKNIILYCKTGVRAEMAHTLFQEAGRKSLYVNAFVTFDKKGQLMLEEK